MSIRAIVFDFGNVVAFFDHRITTNRLVGYSHLTADTIHTFLFGSPLEEAFDSGRITTGDFLTRVHEHCGLQCTREELATAWADIFWPNQNVIGLLPVLKPHYRLLLASNTNALHTQQFSRQFAEPLKWFDVLVFSHDVGACKPRPAFFEHCTRLAQCAPHECLFIDDSAINVAGARAYGWDAIQYTGGDLTAALAQHGIEIARLGEQQRLG